MPPGRGFEAYSLEVLDNVRRLQTESCDGKAWGLFLQLDSRV